MLSASVGELTSQPINMLTAYQAIASVPFVPYVADKFGRRRCTQLGCAIMIVGASLRESSSSGASRSHVAHKSAETAAQNRAMFMVSRVIIGVGITAAIVGASNLISGQLFLQRRITPTDATELAHPKERARLGSLFNAFFFTGSSLAAIITIACFRMASDWAWRVPSLMQVAPALVSFCFIFFTRM